jgi:hypothetical protein
MTTATGRDAIVLDTPDQIGRYRLAVVKQGIGPGGTKFGSLTNKQGKTSIN